MEEAKELAVERQVNLHWESGVTKIGEFVGCIKRAGDAKHRAHAAAEALASERAVVARLQQQLRNGDLATTEQLQPPIVAAAALAEGVPPPSSPRSQGVSRGPHVYGGTFFAADERAINKLLDTCVKASMDGLVKELFPSRWLCCSSVASAGPPLAIGAEWTNGSR